MTRRLAFVVAFAAFQAIAHGAQDLSETTELQDLLLKDEDAKNTKGVRDAYLQYGLPLKAAIEVAARAAAAGGPHPPPPFDPHTADWATIYTGFPQPSDAPSFSPKGEIKCLSNYAICAFAKCKVMAGSRGVPIAECGCLAVESGTPPFTPARPNGLSVRVAASVVTAPVILDAKLRAASLELCSTPGVCAPARPADLNRGPEFNVAPFCQEMQPSPASAGRPTMYGGRFDLVSTFNPTAWVANSTAGGDQGAPAPPTQCAAGGAFAYCETAACLKRPSWNGLPVTCYCPVYTPAAGVPFFVAGAGARCDGTAGPDGKLLFTTNGGYSG